MPYVQVDEQTIYVVRRSDNDGLNQNWPLFFVQIQNDRLLNILDQYLDRLTAVEPLPKENIVRYFSILSNSFVYYHNKLFGISYFVSVI